MTKNPSVYKYPTSLVKPRVSVQRVKSLGGHFACLCREFDLYEVNIIIFKKKREILYTFNHFYSEKSSKEQNSTNLLL